VLAKVKNGSVRHGLFSPYFLKKAEEDFSKIPKEPFHTLSERDKMKGLEKVYALKKEMDDIEAEMGDRVVRSNWDVQVA
jgi:hypothetical protein